MLRLCVIGIAGGALRRARPAGHEADALKPDVKIPGGGFGRFREGTKVFMNGSGLLASGPIARITVAAPVAIAPAQTLGFEVSRSSLRNNIPFCHLQAGGCGGDEGIGLIAVMAHTTASTFINGFAILPMGNRLTPARSIGSPSPSDALNGLSPTAFVADYAWQLKTRRSRPPLRFSTSSRRAGSSAWTGVMMRGYSAPGARGAGESIATLPPPRPHPTGDS